MNIEPLGISANNLCTAVFWIFLVLMPEYCILGFNYETTITSCYLTWYESLSYPFLFVLEALPVLELSKLLVLGRNINCTKYGEIKVLLRSYLKFYQRETIIIYYFLLSYRFVNIEDLLSHFRLHHHGFLSAKLKNLSIYFWNKVNLDKFVRIIVFNFTVQVVLLIAFW